MGTGLSNPHPIPPRMGEGGQITGIALCLSDTASSPRGQTRSRKTVRCLRSSHLFAAFSAHRAVVRRAERPHVGGYATTTKNRFIPGAHRMPHDTPLISTIVAGLVLAFIFGAIANRFKMPPLVGYLVAGVFVGPFTPGFVANAELAGELSEIGVILLMFGVGLHFSLKDLLSVRAIAIPGALVQIAGATAMGLGLGLLMGWTLLAGLIFGLALSV
eukprot:gene5975-7918_t